jgi:NADH-quinone oxidoreductase subunit E
MVARRLAEEAVQPADFAFNNDNQAWAEKRIALYPPGRQQSAVIPLLMRAQEQEGWVSRAAIEQIAGMLSMPYIRVLEVATFYTQFQLQPVGTRAHIQVCGTTPCMLRGAEDLRSVCQRKIHPEAHHTNEDGTLSWEEVECLGACVNAPMVAIFQDTYEDLTPARLEEIIDAFAAGRGDEIRPGPQIERHNAAPQSGRTTLLEEPTATREKFVPPPPPEEPPAAASAAPVASAAPQAATTPGRPREVTEESAPAIKGPSEEAKVSFAKAESERKAAAREAGATGEPAKAMREDAVGAEAEGGKLDAGRKPGKRSRGGAAEGTQAAGTEDAPAAEPAPKANPDEVNPVVEHGSAEPLFVAPGGAPDDLKLISGVGPVLERRLNALGVTRYDQIAAFGAEDVERLDAAMGFRGRIVRDDWVRQAQALATGGVAEYRRVFGRDPR